MRAFVLLAAVAAVAAGGYLLGRTSGSPGAAAQPAAIHRSGPPPADAAAGYREGFRKGRAAVYARAFATAYSRAYRQAFADAGLAAPRHVAVPGG